MDLVQDLYAKGEDLMRDRMHSEAMSELPSADPAYDTEFMPRCYGMGASQTILVHQLALASGTHDVPFDPDVVP
jgi:hypothetical protein